MRASSGEGQGFQGIIIVGNLFVLAVRSLGPHRFFCGYRLEINGLKAGKNILRACFFSLICKWQWLLELGLFGDHGWKALFAIR